MKETLSLVCRSFFLQSFFTTTLYGWAYERIDENKTKIIMYRTGAAIETCSSENPERPEKKLWDFLKIFCFVFSKKEFQGPIIFTEHIFHVFYVLLVSLFTSSL